MIWPSRRDGLACPIGRRQAEDGGPTYGPAFSVKGKPSVFIVYTWLYQILFHFNCLFTIHHVCLFTWNIGDSPQVITGTLCLSVSARGFGHCSGPSWPIDLGGSVNGGQILTSPAQMLPRHPFARVKAVSNSHQRKLGCNRFPLLCSACCAVRTFRGWFSGLVFG